MRLKVVLAFVLVVLVCATAVMPVVSAGSVQGTGKQIRGTGPGNDAKLSSNPLVIPAGVTATITGVECSGDGFWIDGDRYIYFNNANEARGVRLAPGRYYVYPNLKNGQNSASVTVTATW